MKKQILIIATLAMTLLAAPAAWSQAKAGDPLVSELQARKVTTAADGKEAFAPADAAKPGDVLEYTATFRNTGKSTLTRIDATLPIPANAEYIPGTAKPANAKASLDGRTFADLPLKRVVKKNGADVEETVPAREYRALRWFQGELAGEKSASFVARVRVTQ